MTGLGDLRREGPCHIEQCHIEPSLPLQQRASFASHALPPRLWRIAEAVLAWAATTAVSIVAAPIVGPMCVEVWVQQLLVQPPLVRQWRPRITMADIITVLGAGIIRIRPAIELHRDADKAGCVLSKRSVGKSAKRRAHQSVSGTSDVPLSAAQDRRRSAFLHARARRPRQRFVEPLR
jgi:hypothetical protein